MQLLIKRINELSKLSKERQLTSTELAERQKLREEYIQIFKKNFKKQLDNIEIVDEENKNIM